MAVTTVSGAGTGYSNEGTGAPSGGGLGMPDVTLGKQGDYWSLARLKRAYTDYLGSKRNEIVEQQQARRYRHGAHWTADQVKVFNARKQPIVTYNRIGRKIDGIVGLVEKMRADPKAYPNTPQQQQGADLATAAIRSAIEGEKFKAKTPPIAEACAVDGFGGIELVLSQVNGAYDIGLEPVDNEGFFYDPRSKKPDFSDARYLGMGKWVDADVAKDMLPGHEQEIDDAIGSGADLTTNSDGDALWFMPSGDLKSIRLIYVCYRHNGGWCWALFTGSSKLMEGRSYFVDKHGKEICSFIMFSAAVDHDYDRYGFPRNLKSAQDEINQRRSKALHELNTRRIIAEKGAFDDIEKARAEAVRPDGVIERNKGYEAEFDDSKKQADIAGQVKFMEDAKAEVENFGPNPALLGDTGINNRSGRAISLMQQAGIAELGPFVSNYHNWKLRVYEATFCAIRKYWTNERWIRVSGHDGQHQLVALNAMQLNPMGMPIIVNQIGQLDVDIVLDEGPDVVTQQQDMYETLSQVIPAIAPMLSPPEVQAVIQMLVETSPLTAEHKQRFAQASAQARQPNPMQQQAAQIQMAGAAAEVDKTKSETVLNYAKAQEAGMPEQAAPQQQEFELPPVVQVEQAFADIEKTRADAAHKRTLAGAEQAYASMAPFDMAQKAFDAAADRRQTAVQGAFDRQVQREEIEAYKQKPASGA
jgi:hypothetical protein